jgi:hypothetical protein
MKCSTLPFHFLFWILSVSIKIFGQTPDHLLLFTQNLGQISDQHLSPRPDILFVGQFDQVTFHLKKNGLSYQTVGDKGGDGKPTVLYRVDIDWPGCNTNAELKTDQPAGGYSNFYGEAYPEGILKVKSFEGVTFKNIYNGIDLHFYSANGKLKYDYIVHPGADIRQIVLLVHGAEIGKGAKGAVSIKTPYGTLEEAAPLVFQDGKKLSSSWILSKNELRFSVPHYNTQKELLIDPMVRYWGTYYGGAGNEKGKGTIGDKSGNVYLVGETTSLASTVIATSGAYQTTSTAYYDGVPDIFIAKFTPSGTRIWGTYFGGNNGEYAEGIAIDSSANIYITGTAPNYSTTVIASSGAHQTTGPGGFLAKFDSTGQRLWGTYYGAYGASCAVDKYQNVYMTGSVTTNAGTLIATPGAHQTGYGGGYADAYLVKFNSSGVRQWGTFYGGSTDDESVGCFADTAGNVYICGTTDQVLTSSIIATSGAYQAANGSTVTNSFDAFLVKFSPTGTRLWGTFYGGLGTESALECVTDAQNNVYIAGNTANSTNSVFTSPSCHQNSYSNTYLAKFSASGTRLWGTFYGAYMTNPSGLAVDIYDNVYLCGTTGNSLIASTDGFQTTFGGSIGDAFIAKFNPGGTRAWGTYYGGNGADDGTGCYAFDGTNVYLSGTSWTSYPANTIGTSNGHQSTWGGIEDAFLVKFNGCTPSPAPTITSPNANLYLCPGTTTTLQAAGQSTLTWFSSPTSTIALGTGTVYITPTLSPGTYSFYAATNECTLGTLSTQTVQVLANPALTANNGSICMNNTFQINPVGVTSFTVEGGNPIVSPTVTTSYSVIGSNSIGCISNSAITTVLVYTLPVVSVAGGSICPGGTFVLTPTGASSFVVSGNQFTVSPVNTTNYSITGLSTQGCVSSNTAVVTVSVMPSPTIIATGGSVCAGDSFTFNPSGAATYTFSGGQVVSPSLTTSYFISGTSAAGCVSDGSVTVTVNVIQHPTITASGGSVCSGSSFSITPSGASHYSFSSGSSVVNPVTTTSYSISGDVLGCSSANTVVITVVTLPLPDLFAHSTKSVVCPGMSTLLQADGALSYTWYPDVHSDTLTVSPLVTSIYTLEGIGANGCRKTLHLTVLVNACDHLQENNAQLNEVNVFPVPTTNQLFLSIQSIIPGLSVRLCSAEGKLLETIKLNAALTTIDLNRYATGLYWLELPGDRYVKVVKQ